MLGILKNRAYRHLFAAQVIALVGTGLMTVAPGLSEIAYEHPDLPPDHPHLLEHASLDGHRHPIVVDDLHPRWVRT